jgi:hypothetical protein
VGGDVVSAPSAWALQQAVACFQSLSASDAPDTDQDALSLAGDDVHDMLRRVILAAGEAASFAEAIETRIEALQGRLVRYKAREQQLRATAFSVMDVLGETKFVQPEFTATIRAGSETAVITDEELVPMEYKRTTISLNKSAINAALRQGVVIPGVERSNALPSLALKVK